VLKTWTTDNFHRVRIYKMEEVSLSTKYFEMSNSDIINYKRNNERGKRKLNLCDSALCKRYLKIIASPLWKSKD